MIRPRTYNKPKPRINNNGYIPKQKSRKIIKPIEKKENTCPQNK